MEEKFYKEDYVTYLKSSFNVILGKLYLTEYSLVFEGTTNGLFVNKNLVIEIDGTYWHTKDSYIKRDAIKRK